jgi:LuxR family maltose regulon positive regulatory protein
MELYWQILAWAHPGLPQKGGVMAHAGLAHILCEQNQLGAALTHVQLGIDQLDQVGGAWAAHLLYRVLARVQQAKGNWKDGLDALDRAYQIGESTQISLVGTQAAALRACLQLAQGDLGAAEVWAANSGLSPDDPVASHPGWREVEYLSLARVLSAQGRYAEALSLLDLLMQSAQAEERHGSAIAIFASQALVNQAQRNRARALQCLERALALAEPEGYVRTFLDEGEPMRLLIHNLRAAITRRAPADLRLLAYIDRLLQAFAGADLAPPPYASSGQQPSNGRLVDSLSERELEVLRLIQAGYNNQEIAEQLVIAVSTVKTHLNNLYGKFGVHSRTQAVAIARDLGFLSD